MHGSFARYRRVSIVRTAPPSPRYAFLVRWWIACWSLLAGCGPNASDEADLLVVVDGRLHVAWSASGDLEPIDDPPEGTTDTWAVWSPDGNSVARARAFGTQHEIHVVDLRDRQDLVVSTTRGYQLEWSPDGRRIAFRAAFANDQAIDEYELLVAHADGSTEQQLTATTGVTEWMPRWSPDGRWIAVGVDAGIALFSAEGVAGPIVPVLASNFAWSRDSDRFLVSNSNGLQFVDIESESVRAVGDANALSAFAWSEARDRIAFYIRRDDPDGQAVCEILMTGERDAQVRLLSRSDPGFCVSPLEWSPNGEQLLLVRTPFQGPGHEDTKDTPLEIRSVGADGTDERVLVRASDATNPWIEARWRPPTHDDDE